MSLLKILELLNKKNNNNLKLEWIQNKIINHNIHLNILNNNILKICRLNK